MTCSTTIRHKARSAAASAPGYQQAERVDKKAAEQGELFG
jgi:hypothetical protein